TDIDHVPDYLEPNNMDTDQDELINPSDNDDDNDQISTRNETGDSDNDRVPDYLEPNDQDLDEDGLPNHQDNDDDGDSLDTSTELGSNPLRPLDTNNNGTPDYLEPLSITEPTNPEPTDTDSDSLPDAEECPLEPCVDSDHDGTPNWQDPDDDNDGIPTIDELGDTDIDHVPDYLEPNNMDTDQDELINPSDNDDDNDPTMNWDPITCIHRISTTIRFPITSMVIPTTTRIPRTAAATATTMASLIDKSAQHCPVPTLMEMDSLTTWKQRIATLSSLLFLATVSARFEPTPISRKAAQSAYRSAHFLEYC
ncbi:MAG: hypothetical protein P8077_01405, partial [Gammaproteobacteria bacterium]